MRPPSNDGSHATGIEQSARSNVMPLPYRRPDVRQAPSRAWLGIAIALLILLPLSWIAIQEFRPLAPVPGVGRVIAAGTMQLESGASGRLQVYVDPPADISKNAAGMSLKVTESPEWLHVEIPETLPVSQTIELIVTADPVVDAIADDVILVARIGDWTETTKVRVSVRAPDMWRLPEGFEPVPGSEIVRPGGGVSYYRRILRVIDANLNVTFVLIDGPGSSADASNVIPPFYIMQHEVWNELFRSYWLAAVESIPRENSDSDWQKGALAAGGDMGAESQPGLPTVRITALQARFFAEWIGGQTACHLPTIDQWNLASGIKHRATQNAEQLALYPDGPFRGAWKVGTTDVAVNRGQFGPQPVGESRDDVAPTGCTDMAGNVLELTDNLLNGARVSDVDPLEVEGSQLRVLLRGRSYLSESPLTWDDIQVVDDLPDAVGYREVDPTIGFRVVLETAK